MAVSSRNTMTKDVTFATTLAVCTPIAMGDSGQFRIYPPSTSNLTSIAWYACPTETGTYTVCEEQASTTAVTTAITAGKNKPSPDDLFDCLWVKGVGTFSSGTSESITVSQKS